MNYSKTKISNGLRILSTPIPNFESATLTVWVRTGSRNEDEKINGISHFLEHMAFKGSKKRPTAKDIAHAVDEFGGEFNAATNKDWTNFYIKARAGNLPLAFDVLSDMVINPILSGDEIEREKGVIVEEIAMYEDMPLVKINDVFEELLFEGSPLAMDVAGTPKTVKGLVKNDFIRYRDRYYYTDNMLLTVSGGVQEKAVVKLAEKYFSELVNKKSESKTQEFKTKQRNPDVKLKSKKIEQAHFILGFLGAGRGYPGRFAQAVLSSILGGGMSSRLFIEVRERRGLAYSVRTTTERYEDTGYMGVYAGVDPKKADEAIKVVSDQCYGLASGTYPIDKRELSKAKEFIKGHMALALEDTKIVNEFFAEPELFSVKTLTPEEVFSRVDKVNIDDVLFEAKRMFVKEGLNLAIIGPYSNSGHFEKLVK